MELPPMDDPRNWREDFNKRDGQYIGTCPMCSSGFWGHKRRRYCRLCAADQEAMESLAPEISDVPTPADIWKGHAEVWRGVQEDYRKFAEDEEHALNVSDPEADPIRAKIVRGLRDFAEIVAEDYEAKASNPAKESEG